MCGILGSININLDQNHLNEIKHRGPDDFGFNSFLINGHTVNLAQRRLSIIDLSPAGHQPMLSSCHDYAIIFNGEVYNHLDLRKELPNNITYKGHSDTETILYYLKEFGIESIKKFNGIFSLAFLNKKQNKLYLARDHFGVKPLYFYQEGNKLIFSSEIRPIDSLIQKNKLDKNALGTLLRLRYNPAPNTLNEYIKKVQPGHFIEIDLDEQQLKVRFQSFLDEIPKTTPISPSNAINQYGQKLEEAVKRQLLSDVEISILLSGGIDSAIIAALAQQHSATKLKAFTVGFEGNYAEDEIEDAAETANLLGLEHYYKKISFKDFLKVMKECARIVEEPLATTSMIPMYYLSELASKHVKVILTGQGADEPLGGYTRYKSELLRNKIPTFAYTPISSSLAFLNLKNETLARGARALRENNEIERFLASYEVFSVPEIKSLIHITDKASYQRVNYYYDLLHCRAKEHAAERMMGIDARLNLADDLLNYTDKITMNFSLECRVPMLDLELVKFIESLPIEYKLNLKGGKIIHKKYAQTLLPAKIINRKKKGFQSPTNIWFKDDIDQIESLLLVEGTYFSNVFNKLAIKDILLQHKRGFNKEKQIFLLLSLSFWFDSITQDTVIKGYA